MLSALAIPNERLPAFNPNHQAAYPYQGDNQHSWLQEGHHNCSVLEKARHRLFKNHPTPEQTLSLGKPKVLSRQLNQDCRWVIQYRIPPSGPLEPADVQATARYAPHTKASIPYPYLWVSLSSQNGLTTPEADCKSGQIYTLHKPKGVVKSH
ncbi:hypothetical protein DSO57_1001423 [Entomophthora muscae]|uniref:Uncharacterized protein n=1 Tax=Entomophthora muscae TaxID=34485 RepID=A0ACC2TJQ1_9FUNG|nr:hypothetical protein DSO57_1001423 [Entomophthora muscae]